MLLKNLISNVNDKYANVEITGITSDSREIRNGYAFVCIKGVADDGHNYAASAAQKGAVVVITEHKMNVDNEIVVPDTRELYADMCSRWFGNPADSLKLIGVTGTNGKTSITYMLKSILEHAGHKVGLIGTIQNMIGTEVIETKNTTPGVYELNRLFSLMKEKGCDYVVMEVSSHALDQKRVCGLTFETAIFTNLTQDHLDYHITMENYLMAKKRLFTMCKTAVVNSDDEHCNQLIDGLECNIVTYSLGDESTYSAKAVKYWPTSVEYELVSNNILNHIKFNTGGKFSVYNSLCAVVTALELGFSIDTVSDAIESIEGIKGRAESVPTGRDFTVIIDYAHTPDGLKNILKTFSDCEKNRVIVLFGCGGDRDKTKRPIMGGIAARYADYVIVTSDNPRSEDPDKIIDDILVGTNASNTPIKVISNRVEAIKYAISMAQAGDIIILAGKGHETYQILNTGTIHLDEREIVNEALDAL
ncbi:MAG: UDP-N-acetylmuramoyl-L-alanyl-D-glutamate--2,6-diaminopimelate ligase [Ruminococcaceae bacterium]|nr:UDP-N-acetylmuramoyl-L-alanyl-D-glutamate--2,6-diaminopimelate ligase [Oscillospiraceae bacterium]